MKMNKSTPRSRRHRNSKSPEAPKETFFNKSSDPPIQQKAEPAFFQTQLNIGEPDDQYEQEADKMADAVVHSNNTESPAIQQQSISAIQRYATNAQEDELGTNTQRIEKDKQIQEKPEVQRMNGEEDLQKMEEEKLQKAEEDEVQKMDNEELQEKEEEDTTQLKSNAPGNTASPQITNQLQSTKGQGQALPAKTKEEMSSSFGYDFSETKIHTDQKAEQMNRELGAQAFTHGKDVYFNKDKYNPETKSGQHLLAHELTHVVQQDGGQQQTAKKEANKE